MKQETSVNRPWRVIIVGGGFGGLRATQALKSDVFDMTLIDRRNYHLYQPLLCGHTDAAAAVVATFRIKKPSPDGNDTYLTARLSYRTKENIVIREIEREIHRVNYGTWLDEGYHFVRMRITDTKELVLARNG